MENATATLNTLIHPLSAILLLIKRYAECLTTAVC